MFNFSDFYHALSVSELNRWSLPFKDAIDRNLARPDGNSPGWQKALSSLPGLEPGTIDLHQPAVSVQAAGIINNSHISLIKDAMMQLKPWRKGPFTVCGVDIDSEWRSDLKWDRVSPHISSLQGRKVLDVGCGNGYHMFRMAAQQPETVLGVDPSLLFLAQFNAVKRYAPRLPVYLLPIGFEDLPATMEAFDTVFSMGVFYHRRAPFDFLRSLKLLLRQGGELILETLIIDGDQNQVLVPPGRYARMNNVWFIPSVAAMLNWLTKAGFINIKVVDVCPTTSIEQRTTEWMPGESLAQCIAPDNSALTIEGLPAPVRAVFICNRP